MAIFTVPAFAVTTKSKILGATYGFSVVPMVMNQRLDRAASGFSTAVGYGFGDMFVQPISPGWRTERADFLAGYGFFAPTGKGARSLDMWGHELSAGTTVYLDSAKKWDVAATGFYDIYQQRVTRT
jgi:hypothetical protein